MALSNLMSLRPGLSWLTLNVALLFSVYHEIIYIFFNFTYPLRCFLVPPGVRVTQVEDHCIIVLKQPKYSHLNKANNSSSNYTNKYTLFGKNICIQISHRC
jgi:hypothetical protein